VLQNLLALDIAVAVASGGTPCLRQFAVPNPGRCFVRSRGRALEVRQPLGRDCARRRDHSRRAGRPLITSLSSPGRGRDREELESTVAAFKPRLLVLDPFVGCIASDENA